MHNEPITEVPFHVWYMPFLQEVIVQYTYMYDWWFHTTCYMKWRYQYLFYTHAVIVRCTVLLHVLYLSHTEDHHLEMLWVQWIKFKSKIIHVTAIHYGTTPKKINVIIEIFLMIHRVSAMPRTNNTYNSK